MFKKILSLFIILSFAMTTAIASENYTLKSGISVLDNIPKQFYGTWRVTSELISTNNEAVFKQKNIDLWNISRTEDVITLDNPFSGAKASITIDEANGNLISLKKLGIMIAKN